jgi:putative ABC transport system substrate-binding protein
MRRRDVITLLGGAAAWPLGARAQQPSGMRRIGVLTAYSESDPEAQARVGAFREGLQKLGWTEGRDIRIDARWATSDAALMQRFAQELVALQPELILSSSRPTTAALLHQTRTIPIIFAIVADPVGSGFVASFPRPGGNVTGFTDIQPTIAGKWLELLKEIAPRVARVAFLFNPVTAPHFEYYLNVFKAAAASFRSGGGRRTCSRQVPARLRHCRTGTRAEWRLGRDGGCLHSHPSRGDHLAGGALPSPCRLFCRCLH